MPQKPKKCSKKAKKWSKKRKIRKNAKNALIIKIRALVITIWSNSYFRQNLTIKFCTAFTCSQHQEDLGQIFTENLVIECSSTFYSQLFLQVRHCVSETEVSKFSVFYRVTSTDISRIFQSDRRIFYAREGCLLRTRNN